MDFLVWLENTAIANAKQSIARARKSPRILRRMSAVLEETANPGNLVSLRGILRLPRRGPKVSGRTARSRAPTAGAARA